MSTIPSHTPIENTNRISSSSRSKSKDTMDDSIVPISISKLLGTKLGLYELLRRSYASDGSLHSSDENSHYWFIPPSILTEWSHNRHGTIHGGLSLALLITFCKARVGLLYGDDSDVIRASVQYLRPVYITSPLVVRTSLEVVDKNIVRATVELYTQKQKEEEERQQQERKKLLLSSSSMLCRAFITIARRPSVHSHL
ncbi:Thioesterase domain [Trypanosoma melophagium]|uniref:Thioesterase domain n=1 Tax=Trypanosoma melophagium TaxID=715481 RepID=UPI003519DEE5|nr:Thioesterase domain [Trypanosoma melophagium]